MRGRSDRRFTARSSRSRRARLGAALAGVVAVLVGPTLLPAASSAAATGVVPAYDHIFWVVDSGQPAAAVIGPATYLTGLAGANAQATAYTAVDPSPLADRLALTGGQTGGVGDCTPAQCPQSGDNLATRIEASGRSWRAYAESMPSPCSTSATTDFAPERVPFLYETALASECATGVVPYTQLASDLASTATTPSFVWIGPNLQHDMSSSVVLGDSWLLANLPALFGSPAWRTQHSLLVVVVDQPGAAAAGAPVPAVVVASDGSVRSGYSSAAAYNHYDLLSTVEASWGLPALTGNDGGAVAMSDMFTAQATPAPAPSPTAAPSPAAPPAQSPGATPTATPTPTRSPRPVATPAPSPASSAPPGAPATPAPAPSGGAAPHASAPAIVAATPGSNEFTLAAPTVDVTDLTYAGPTTIASGSIAALPVLEFTASSLTMSSGSPGTPALNLQMPCSTQDGLSLSQVVSVSGSATAGFSGAVTLYVTSIDFTYLGNPFSLSAAAPPVSFATITSGTLTGLTAVAAQLKAATTSLPTVQSVAYFQC